MTEQIWKLDQYKPEDKADILAMNREEYGDVALASEAYFDWLQSKNPMDKCFVRVVREDNAGKIIAFGMYLSSRMSWRGQSVMALIGANLVVKPEFRRRGISLVFTSTMHKEFQEQGYRFSYVFPNPRSKPSLIRNDFTTVCQIPLVIRPLNIGVLTSSYVQNIFLRWGVNIGWQTAGQIIWREHEPSRNGFMLDIVENSEIDEAYEHFWEKVKTKYNLLLVRDRAFMQWRFIDIPHRKYTVLSARRGRDILGYVVLRQARIRKTEVGMISDFMVLPGEDGSHAGLALLHEALQRFRRNNMALSGGLMLPHTEEYGLLRRAGYLPAPAKFAPQPFYLLLKPMGDEPPLSDLSCPQNWFISIADHDAV